MFTGIVSQTGKIASIEKEKGKIKIQAPVGFFSRVKKGDSVSVDGICLTAVKVGRNFFDANIMKETFGRTNLGRLKKRDLVNLELPARADSFLSGHIVQGHIDGTAILKKIIRKENGRLMTFSLSPALARYMVSKGSVALNGISLTIISANARSFSVGIISHTWERTALHLLRVGESANVEVDMVAKYVKKFIKKK